MACLLLTVGRVAVMTEKNLALLFKGYLFGCGLDREGVHGYYPSRDFVHSLQPNLVSLASATVCTADPHDKALSYHAFCLPRVQLRLQCKYAPFQILNISIVLYVFEAEFALSLAFDEQELPLRISARRI